MEPSNGSAENAEQKEEKDTTFEGILKGRKKRERMSGILANPTSFPSRYGIGDLGWGAEEFINFLAASHQHVWQVLPLGPTGFGDSPYQSLSAFAGQPYIISPDLLHQEGLLWDEDLWDVPQFDPKRVDYGSAISYKMELLRRSYRRFRDMEQAVDAEKAWKPFGEVTDRQRIVEGFGDFIVREKGWLFDYALYMAVKDDSEGKCWTDWDEDIRDGLPEAKKEYSERLAGQIRFYEYIQYLFDRQWRRIRLIAAEKEIWIIGDMPIFMAMDCTDVWANKKLFKLASKGFPTEIAGVPPDYFSATGQLWGNPLYDWAYHKKTGYAWWIARLKRQFELVDYVRIDHFRGFESYWAVPYGEETAVNGEWKKGPGLSLFKAVRKALGEDVPIIAEDLGIITPEVEKLRDDCGFPGMKVLQFGFGDMNDKAHIPHRYTTTNCVCYTGTHDNETTVGWYQHQPEEVKDRVRLYGNCDGSSVSLDFIRFALGSVAKLAIFPLQDVLQLGNESRMNTPGAPAGNWSFRYESWQLEDWRRDFLARYTRIYSRE